MKKMALLSLIFMLRFVNNLFLEDYIG